MAKVIISADSTCDIGPELQQQYNIQLLNFRIELNGRDYIDNVTISPDEMYQAWREHKILPKTSAATPFDYKRHFTPLLAQGYEIVHLNLGSGISSSFQNCRTAAEELGNIYPIDTQNLSTGSGLLVIQAAKLAQMGLSASQIQNTITNMVSRSHASFLLDTLDFMKAGGRCSAVAAMGANLFKIKPCIEVDNQDGSRMHVGKKYRGDMEKCLRTYVKDKLDNRTDIDSDRVFITHSGSPQSDIAAVVEEIGRYQQFKEIYVTRANGIISTHCGPRTLGILFMTKQ